MPAGDVVYGTRTALENTARLHSDASGVATAFGEIDNTTTKALDYNIHIVIPINASATTGTYAIYAVSSQDGAEWTDNIDPASDADYTDFIKDARLVRAASTVYDNSPTGARVEVEFHFNLAEIFPGAAIPQFVGFVCKNNSGQAIPASGADGDYVSIKIATS